MSNQQLQVSVITPTYNRTEHIRNAIKYYRAQNFLHIAMEWIILDDGTEPVEAIFMDEADDLPNIKYIREYSKMSIGAKRNRLNALVRSPLIVAWDDDDYYPPDRISMIVEAFKCNPDRLIAGSSLMYYYFKDDKSIWSLGPFGPNHSCNGPLAYRSTYLRNHKYNDNAQATEETQFLNDYTEPMIQLDPMKAILVMVHENNTVSKASIRIPGNRLAAKTGLTLEDFGLAHSLKVCPTM